MNNKLRPCARCSVTDQSLWWESNSRPSRYLGIFFEHKHSKFYLDTLFSNKNGESNLISLRQLRSDYCGHNRCTVGL